MSIPWVDDGTGFSPWDSLILGGVYMPGRAKVSVSGSRDVVDEKPKGEDGPTQSDNGYLGADVTIVVELWSRLHLADFAASFSAWTPRKPGELSAPLDIIHPGAQLCNVTKVRVKGWSVPHPERQKILVTLTCREWFPPGSQKPAQSAQESKSGAGGSSAGGGANAGAGAAGGAAGGAYGEVPPEPDPEGEGGNVV